MLFDFTMQGGRGKTPSIHVVICSEDAELFQRTRATIDDLPFGIQTGDDEFLFLVREAHEEEDFQTLFVRLHTEGFTFVKLFD